MIVRAWRVWGVLAVLICGFGLQGKPPESPITPAIDGTATPILTQDYYQPEPGPSPRLLNTPEIVPAVLLLPKRGLPLPITPTAADLDVPVRATFMGRGTWQATTAFSIAEMNLEGGEIEEARRWYEEVIRQSPNCVCAREAEDRLARTKPRSK